MALNTSKQAIIDNRRLQVAQLRLRGATQREIETELARSGHINPGTSKPWSLGIINADIKIMEKRWGEAAAKETAVFKAEQLAEIRAARRLAWQNKALADIRQLIKLEMDLIGTDAPKRQEHTGADGKDIAIRFIKENRDNDSD